MTFSLAKMQSSKRKGESGRSVNLAGRAVSCTVRVSERAKNVRLQVSLEKGLEVVVPKKFNLRNLENILREKQDWILDKLDHFTRLAEKQRLLRREGGWRIFYRGREFEVETKEAAGSARQVAVEEEKLTVTVPEGAGEEAAAVLEAWLRRMARMLINQRIRVVNKKLNLSFNRVFIRDQKTRWGSCSRQKNLNFNWRLVMAPLPVLDYVVAHELVHLAVPNHSEKFWARVEEVCPGCKDYRAWLKKNGRLLTI
ncbi:MAG: M48 family metallopeptidase [Eubacteriales bacterium]